MKRIFNLLVIAAIIGVFLFIRLPVNHSEQEAKVSTPSAPIDTKAIGPKEKEIVSNLEVSVAAREEEPDKQPSSYFFEQRAFPKNKIDIRAVARARTTVAAQLASRGSATQTVWNQQGPYNIQGRVTDIAVDPLNDSIAYVAAAEGGVFRTTDAGNSWQAMFDFQSSLSMGALAIDPINSNIIYAGTGEANPGGGSMAYGGAGLYRSTNQGVTWTNIGLEDSGAIGRIIIHPTNPDIIHVAVMGHLWTAGTDRGVYRTTDGGITWTKVLFVNTTTGCIDIIQREDDPDILYAAMWQRIRMPEVYDYGGIGCGVYKSDDGGITWSLAGNGLPAPSFETGRIGLAIGKSDPDVMCAIYADRTGFFDGLYRTEDGGQNWFQTNDGGLSNAYSSFGWWFGNVRIDPLDADVIYVVGFRVYRSDDGGLSYGQVGNNMHVDHHAMDFGSNVGDNLYAGNDGGVYVSTDGINYSKTTGDLPITQAYRIASRTWNPDALWIGTQDNGTSQDLDGDGDFQPIFGGDGFEPLPHPTDPNRIWAQYQYGNVSYSSNQGASFSSATAGLLGRFNWNAPHSIDPSDPETRYYGSNLVFRNDGNEAWLAISGDLTGGIHLGNNGQVNGTLTTISVSPADGDVIWSGSDDGFVHVTDDGGTTWTDVSTGLPLRWVTSVRSDQSTPGKAYVTLSGFRWGESLSQVFQTDDFGQTWTSIGDNIPDGPVNDILIDPVDDQRLFVATDFGVYRTDDSGGSWFRYGDGLPNVVANDLSFLPTTRQLFAGTYGRSIFSIVVPEVTVTAIAGKTLDGVVTAGSLSDVYTSNDIYYEFDPSLTKNPQKQIVDLILQGVGPESDPGFFKFRLQAKKTGGPVGDVVQEISMFNHNTNSFEAIDTRAATNEDSVVLVEPSGDVTRFIHPLTDEVTTKLTWKSPAFSGSSFTWDISIDEAVWLIQ